jgi:hypothetical protein
LRVASRRRDALLGEETLWMRERIFRNCDKKGLQMRLNGFMVAIDAFGEGVDSIQESVDRRIHCRKDRSEVAELRPMMLSRGWQS